MKTFRVPRVVLGLVALLIVALACVPARAQSGRPVELIGSVQWIAATRLMLIVHNVGGVIAVDLTRVPLDEYQTLRARDPIAVIGVVSDDEREILATSIIRIPEEQAP